MDPIAHTLAGATLAQTGLRKLTPLATATLVIGANLPDIDGVMSFLGSDASLFYRRGLTHGIVAQLLLPLLLTAAILAFDRLVRRRHRTDLSPARPLQIMLLAYIGVISHPLLDWLNTYGVRLLMPFSGRWFYGDTLFIVDAWMWLLMGAAVVLGYSQTRWSQVLWIGLGLATSALVTGAAFVPWAAKLVWWLGILVIGALRIRGLSLSRQRMLALGCVAAFCLYLAATSAGNQQVQNKVRDWIRTNHGEDVTDVMTGPLPANPFYREVVAVSSTHYYGLLVPVFNHAEIEQRFERIPLPKQDPIIHKALSNPDIRGFVNWMRFPIYDVEVLEQGYRVVIRDLRYVRPDQNEGRGIGMVETFVPL
ncbi:MAG TPA: metal-dependent hydrolase [Oligoflexus sp.]|uniref:metal-dependent hydrolase n=1 Tax=Oligoflexus sp. TaxID=1971216 RepID=UPI002D80C9DC|nr:metal-dependent hydrolase [Oligoflexus sp.]HET9240017.1 metal-dependent hydrolase [Oligoflexus sp.]